MTYIRLPKFYMLQNCAEKEPTIDITDLNFLDWTVPKGGDSKEKCNTWGIINTNPRTWDIGIYYSKYQVYIINIFFIFIKSRT